jgi:hypothetical protein
MDFNAGSHETRFPVHVMVLSEVKLLHNKGPRSLFSAVGIAVLDVL